jgi:hypothetical protein
MLETNKPAYHELFCQIVYKSGQDCKERSTCAGFSITQKYSTKVEFFVGDKQTSLLPLCLGGNPRTDF